MPKSLLPFAMQDNSNLAMEKCLNKALNIDLSAFMTCLVDRLNADVLFYKAEQYSLTDGDDWENCTTIEEKRELIKKSIKIHRMKSTVNCIKSLLAQYSNEIVKYLQWNEYDGINNHYKLNIDFQDSSVLNKLIAKIENNKRLSSKCDEISATLAMHSNLNLISFVRTELIYSALPIL